MRWIRHAAVSMACASVVFSERIEAQPAAAEDDAACLAPFTDAQRRRATGELIAARDLLRQCMLPTCLDVVRAKCTIWHNEVENEIPTVIVRAVDGQGKPILDASLTIDGQPVPGALSGLAQQVDPGDHLVRVERPGGGSVEERVAVLQGQRNQIVELAFPPPVPVVVAPREQPRPPPVSPDEPWRMHPVAWVGFGVAAAGVIAGSVTGGIALAKGDDCEDEGCTADEISKGRRIADASTACFVAAGAGAALGITILVIDEMSSSSDGAATLSLRTSATGVGGMWQMRF